MATLEKARKSFDYQCKQASNCRHEKYMASCNCCPLQDTCDIQKKIETARGKTPAQFWVKN